MMKWSRAPAALMLALACATTAGILAPNTTLSPSQSISSDNGRYLLVMQGDGNLVYYRTTDWVPRWHSQTYGNPGAFAPMQGDGNLVVYTGTGMPIWNSQTSGNPGAYLAAQDDGNLVIYGSGRALWNIGVDVVTGDPQLAGDVVGRDLAISGLGSLGHTGMYDGSGVVEVLDEGGNAIRYESLASFKARSAYWGTASPNNPNHLLNKCFKTACLQLADFEDIGARMALVKRAFQAYLIGADYTYGQHYTSAKPMVWGRLAQRGLYRCDTFIINVYEKTADDEGMGSIYPVPQLWLDRNRDLKSDPILPSTLFNKMKGWN
ncbi:hypothetical protein J7E62_25560 [Variovorax paradoxus]|nr:hypothetical protein [Variovorax paradoxus]